MLPHKMFPLNLSSYFSTRNSDTIAFTNGYQISGNENINFICLFHKPATFADVKWEIYAEMFHELRKFMMMGNAYAKGKEYGVASQIHSNFQHIILADTE
jgi:hypothetical protein